MYATDGYPGSADHLAGTSLTADTVFDDGGIHQLATVSGSAGSGYTATLTVAV